MKEKNATLEITAFAASNNISDETKDNYSVSLSFGVGAMRTSSYGEGDLKKPFARILYLLHQFLPQLNSVTVNIYGLLSEHNSEMLDKYLLMYTSQTKVPITIVRVEKPEMLVVVNEQLVAPSSIALE